MYWAGLFFLALILASVTFVALRGTKWERLGMAIVFAGSLATFAVALVFGRNWSNTLYSVLAIDLAALLAFGFIALRSDRFWPLWVTGMQLAQLTTHMARMADPAIVRRAYEAGQGVWSWLQILVIVLATWHLHRRMGKTAPENRKS